MGGVGLAFGEFFGLFLLGIALYALRRFSRLIYGIIECAAALVGLLGPIGESVFGKSGQGFEYFAGDKLVILAALYVLVRALDNIGEGLKAHNGGTYPHFWTRIFPEAQ
jgi:hypothetical protein